MECKSAKCGLHVYLAPSSTGTNQNPPSLLACGIYYYFWAFLIPKWKGYKLRQEQLSLDGGVQSNRLKKVPNDEVAEWDATHDAAGRIIESPVEIQVQVKGIDV